MKKIFVIFFATFTTLLADYSDKIIADIEREIAATLYLLEEGERNFMKPSVVDEFSLGPINDYQLEEYILRNTTEENKKKILKTINKYMKKYFPNENDKFIKKIVVAQMMVESSFNKNAIGDTDTDSPAYGLMQVRLSTARYMQTKIPSLKEHQKETSVWLSEYLQTVEGAIEYGMGYLYLKKKYNDYNKINNKDKFFKMISLYNGGIRNHKYVNKVFKEITEMDRI